MTEPDPLFVAYVYPGWHQDDYRPDVDEWDLLDCFEPRFPGHLRPPMPLNGPYDDSLLKTAREQVRLAADHGMGAFTYFTYYGPQGFAMNQPMRVALQAAEEHGDFGIGATWCMRLPHSHFPVAPDEDHDDDAHELGGDEARAAASLDDLPIDRTTLADIDRLLGETQASELRLGGVGLSALARKRSERSASSDRAARHRRT